MNPLLSRFIRLGTRLCMERGLDECTIDFASIYDPGKSYYENREVLFDRINSLERQFRVGRGWELSEQHKDFCSQPRNNHNSLARFL